MNVLTPNPFDNLVAGDQLPPLFHQKQQKLHGDAFELQPPARTAKFVAANIQLQVATQTNWSRRFDRIAHNPRQARTSILHRIGTSYANLNDSYSLAVHKNSQNLHASAIFVARDSTHNGAA